MVVEDIVDDAGWDLEPTSEVRPVAGVRYLVVQTALRSAQAEAAWVTITDAADSAVVLFEGALRSDGSVHIPLDSAPDVKVARVVLETPRQHRTVEVELSAGTSALKFEG